MTLRRPAAHLRRPPSWRRSGDESYWESLMSEGECVPRVSRPARPPRPQSAIEGGQLDGWLEHLQRMESDLLRAPVHDRASAFKDRTSSMPALDKGQTGHTLRHQGISSFSRGSSRCGSPSLCESSLGSQESLQTVCFSPSERRGNWERARIIQAPRREQAQLSYLAPVKIGWLPIQRRVMMVADSCSQKQFLNHSAGQMKLKQPITPTLQKNQPTSAIQDYPGKAPAACRNQSNASVAERNFDRKCGEVVGGHATASASGARTWPTADQGSPAFKKVPEKQSFPANEEDRPGGWKAPRRGWNADRLLAFPRCSQSIELPTGTNIVPNREPPSMKTTSVEPLRYTPLHRTTSADSCRPHTLLQGQNSTETYHSHAPLHRTSSAQPIRANAPLLRTNSSQPTRIQTSSVATTLVPQSKAGISSITISSRKVSGSGSLPGSDPCDHSSRSSESCSPPRTHQPMDPNSRHVTVQRKATIVKVTEQRVMSSPAPSRKKADAPPAAHGLDTVVHRRKATIIKVTEHRESYSPANVGSRTRHPEYRHSYTEGLYKDKNTWHQGNYLLNPAAPSYHHLKGPNQTVAPNKPTSDLEKNGGALHRSTLNLFVSNTPAIAAAAPLEVSPKAVGQRSDRPRRPLSCYGNVFGHTEPSKENATRPAARKWSFGLQQDTGIKPANPYGSFLSPGAAGKEAGRPAADALRPNGEERERAPALPEDGARRASPSLTLINAPDPHSRQSPEEVLAFNAAAIIANIKLQRQLSKMETPNVNSEKDSTASPLGNTVTDVRVKPHPDPSPFRRHSLPRAAIVPLSLGPERSPETVSLQDALQRSRPDFISRSQGRVQELERRAQERRELADSADSESAGARRQRRAHSARPTSLNDNLFKPGDKAITGKEMHPRSRRTLAEAKRKKDEEKNREMCLSNRQRVELFKKKLLDQILHRSNN